MYPLDTLKLYVPHLLPACLIASDNAPSRMQCETVPGGLRGNRLIIETAKKMWKHNGIVAFYRGLPMGLVGMFPYAAIDLGTFEFLKRTLTGYNAKKYGGHEENASPGGFTTALIGGFSGAFGASTVYPLNLLRTRLQSQGTASHPRTYTGIIDVTRQTIQGEGVRGLFKGLTPNLLKVVPAVSIVSLASSDLASSQLTIDVDLCRLRENQKGTPIKMRRGRSFQSARPNYETEDDTPTSRLLSNTKTLPSDRSPYFLCVIFFPFLCIALGARR